MEELDVDGLFWLVRNPEDTVAGHLRFDAKNGAELALIGSFSTPGDREAEAVRIHGIAGKKRLTLDGCSRVREAFEVPGIYRETYYAAVILAGAHFDEEQPLAFSALHLRFRHLEQWIGKTGLEYTFDEISEGVMQTRITHTTLKKSSVHTSLGELELAFPHEFKIPLLGETTFKETCVLSLRTREPLSLEDAFEACAAIQHLITIGVDAPIPATSMSLSHPDFVRTLPNGKVIHDEIKLYTQFRGSDVQSDTRSIHPAEMMFSFDDIGGLDGIASWLKTAARFEPVIGSLLSHWYLPTMYTDNRFLNIVIAAEAMERIRTGRQNIDFREGLESLARDAGGDIRYIGSGCQGVGE